MISDLLKPDSVVLTIYNHKPLRDFISKFDQAELVTVIPMFLAYPEGYEQYIMSEIASVLGKCKSTFKESIELELADEYDDSLPFSKF